MMSDLARDLAREIAACARVRPEAVTLDAHLVADLGLSSLDVLTVLAFAESRYGITFPDDDLHAMATLRGIERAIAACRTQPTDEGATR